MCGTVGVKRLFALLVRMKKALFESGAPPDIAAELNGASASLIAHECDKSRTAANIAKSKKRPPRERPLGPCEGELTVMRYGHSRKRPHHYRKAFSGRGDIDLNQILGNWALTEMTY